MISEAEALASILAATTALPAETLPLARALGRFSARDLRARLPLPVFDNSSMDGYAVQARETRPGARLRLVGEQPAGLDRGLRLAAGEAIRILTGAPIPAGADAVIMQEDVQAGPGEIILQDSVATGENIRQRGCELTPGQGLLQAGEPLTPAVLGLLAAQGFTEVETGGQVGVAIISTGDELARPGAMLAAGQIYESNSVLLQALVRSAGGETPLVLHARDEPEELQAAMARALEFPVLILSGGVSVGARDFVKPALTALGAETGFWRVAIKPGKPFLFGRRGASLIFGLPGNPVSAFVTFLLLVRPALLKMMGASDAAARLPQVPARAAVALVNDGDRPHYLRGRINAGAFTPAGRQESHALFGLSQANALVRLAPGQAVAAGELVEAMLWS